MFSMDEQDIPDQIGVRLLQPRQKEIISKALGKWPNWNTSDVVREALECLAKQYNLLEESK